MPGRVWNRREPPYEAGQHATVERIAHISAQDFPLYSPFEEHLTYRWALKPGPRHSVGDLRKSIS